MVKSSSKLSFESGTALLQHPFSDPNSATITYTENMAEKKRVTESKKGNFSAKLL
jgi:hypothetical protein